MQEKTTDGVMPGECSDAADETWQWGPFTMTGDKPAVAEFSTEEIVSVQPMRVSPMYDVFNIQPLEESAPPAPMTKVDDEQAEGGSPFILEGES